MSIFKKEYTVGHLDIGTTSKMANIGFLRMLEDIASLHGSTMGLSPVKILETKLTWIILGWHVEILERPQFLEKITISTWITGIYKKIYSFRDFEIYNESGKLIAKASSKWLLYNIEKKMPVRIVDGYLDKFNPVENFVFGTLDSTSLKEITADEEVFNYTVLKKDIDVNLHLHNTHYLSIAEETLPMDIFKDNLFNNFNIAYKKQFLYNDLICCHLKVDEDGSYNVSLKDSNNITHAYVKFY